MVEFKKTPVEYAKAKDKQLDEMYMELAVNMSRLSTCSRVSVGAILVIGGRPILSGYNGSPSGHEHCRDIFLAKYKEYMAKNSEPVGIFTFEDYMRLPEIREEHGKFSRLHEVHAEINIISQAASKGLSVEGGKLYITHSPCNDCCKSILTSKIGEVIFLNLYDRETEGLEILLKSGVRVKQIELVGREVANVFEYQL